jgi:hypothetical protein
MRSTLAIDPRSDCAATTRGPAIIRKAKTLAEKRKRVMAT